jgi:voltage-gated potassium channel
VASEAVVKINPLWEELDKRARRRELVRIVLAIALTWAALFVVYVVAPFDSHLSAALLIRLSISMIIVVVVFIAQFRSILHARFPVLRAARALAVVIPLFLVLFSGIYLSLSHTSTTDFNVTLNHTSAMYFTITTFSSVGFGDITPHTGLAQMVVSIQMLLDLVIVATGARLLFHAAQRSRGRGIRQADGPTAVTDGGE